MGMCKTAQRGFLAVVILLSLASSSAWACSETARNGDSGSVNTKEKTLYAYFQSEKVAPKKSRVHVTQKINLMDRRPAQEVKSQ